MSWLDNHTDADIHLLATAIAKMQQMLGGQRVTAVLTLEERQIVRETLADFVMEDKDGSKANAN